jgi:PKD repeat protein
LVQSGGLWGCVAVRRLFAAAALVAASGFLAVAAQPAGAIIVRLPGGHSVSFDAQIGGHLPAAVSKPKISNRDSIFHNLDYSGGPVMPSNTNYVIAWTPQGYSGAPFQDKGFDTNANGWSNDNLGYINGVAQFFKDLATDSAAKKTTNSDAVSTQYNDASGHTAAYTSSYGGGGTAPNAAWIDNDPVPGGGSGCPWAATNSDGGDAVGHGGFCVTDAQVQQELNHFLSAHNLPRGLTNEYFLLTPPDIVTCFDAAGSRGSCSANSANTDSQAFCGYHSYNGIGANEFIYANIPDSSGTLTNSLPDGLLGCDPYVTNAECGPSGLDFCDYLAFSDGVLSAVSHEHNESITDPEPNDAWTDFEQSPPYQGGTEIGDLCNDDAGNGDGTQYVEQNNFHYYPYNETIGSRTYWIQGEWSNEYRGCQFSGTFSAPPGSIFQVTGQAGDTVSFNATGSCGNVSHIAACSFPIAAYTWQFNDDVVPGDSPQQYTVSCPAAGGGPAGCNGALMSHTFPRPGTYRVALTTQNNDGRTAGWAMNVTVYAATQAAFTSALRAVEHSPISFNASATTHDPHFSIASYSWNWGDGSPLSSGVSPTHTYSRAGHYTVTLTVHDSHGGTSAVAHAVTVTDLPPSASFSAPSGRVGTRMSFTGHGSDRDESIAAYRWTFGDGSRSSGQHVSHTFRHAGTFHVTLTVRDASGMTASVTHNVVVKRKKKRR